MWECVITEILGFVFGFFLVRIVNACWETGLKEIIYVVNKPNNMLALNKNVFTLLVKESKPVQSLISCGRALQSTGPQIVNDLEPYVFNLTLGTLSNCN